MIYMCAYVESGTPLSVIYGHHVRQLYLEEIIFFFMNYDLIVDTHVVSIAVSAPAEKKRSFSC